MKTWNTPVVETVEVSETQYGGTSVTKFDSIYQNAEGNWEGTFKAS